jgi:predicted PurR-regulated permease PerM
MLGIDERALRVIWTIFLFALLVAIVYYIRDTLLVFALAIFFAYMLWPIVGLIERFIPRRRNIALALVYASLTGILVLVGFELVPKIAEQASNLGNQLPSLLSRNRLANFPLPGWLDPFREQVVAALTREAASLEASVGPFIREQSTKIISGVGALLLVILIPILAFFFLKDGESIRVNLIGAVEPGRDQTLVQRVLDDVHVVLKSYIRALVLLALASFIAWVTFLSIMGYSYELLLAGTAGLLEFIPVIGPATALAVMLIVCGVTGSGGLFWVVVFWGLYRLFADYVLNPYLMSAGVEIHPLLVLFGVLAGERIAGIPGMFFSIPAIAILRVLYTHLRKAYTGRRITTVRAPAQEDLPPSIHVQARE